METTTTERKRPPKMPKVIAKSMLYAQGWKPSKAEMAAMIERAEWLEEMEVSTEVHIGVYDFHGAWLGSIVFADLLKKNRK